MLAVTELAGRVVQARVRFRGELAFEAHRLLYHSTLCLRVIKKKQTYQVGAGLGVMMRCLQARDSARGAGVPRS